MKLKQEQLSEMLALMTNHNFEYIWLKESDPILYFNRALGTWADAKGNIYPDPTRKTVR